MIIKFTPKHILYVIGALVFIFSCNSSVEKPISENNDISESSSSRERRLKAMLLIDSVYIFSNAANKDSITESRRDSLNYSLMQEYSKIYSTLSPFDTVMINRYRIRKFLEIDKLNNNWEYDSTINKMGENIKFARVKSTDLVYFDFPYSGGSRGAITIRKKRGDLDIYFTISKGQIDTGIDETYIRVKFDDDKPVTYSMSESEDGSSDILFFNNESAFLKKIKKSKKMVVEVPFYQNGFEQFEFKIRNLVW